VSTETTVPEGAASGDDAEALARRLGEAIAETDAHERFVEARRAVQESDEAQERIAEFERLREEYALAKRAGEADADALAEVQAAQRELHSMPVMAEYLDAQDALGERLSAIDAAISAPLDVDFADEAGGCCADD
jgi:cell fate (sporulation/competence/biofilm development) regulator YlbF (YheA/YmcA/DUF963 family)